MTFTLGNVGVFPASLAVEDCGLSLKIILEEPQKTLRLISLDSIFYKKYYSEKEMYYYHLIIPGI